MDIPEDLRHLVDELGEALVRALVEDEQCRDLVQHIQAAGFDMALSLEATVVAVGPAPEEDEALRAPWSQEDQALLSTYRISLD